MVTRQQHVAITVEFNRNPADQTETEKFKAGFYGKKGRLLIGRVKCVFATFPLSSRRFENFTAVVQLHG
jgi:hypothetical protein